MAMVVTQQQHQHTHTAPSTGDGILFHASVHNVQLSSGFYGILY